MLNIIAKLKNQELISEDDAYEMQKNIISGKVDSDSIIEIFKNLPVEKISSQILLGIVRATREVMGKIDVDFDCLDTCSTGGDKIDTFNISTIVALICATAGISVAKHGNRASSSKCGGADILESLGVKIDLDKNKTKKCLEEIGFAFCFAPIFHPALKYVKESRINFGQMTYFNILGPMLNPAQAPFQLIGVTNISRNLIQLIGETLIKTGSKKIIIVSGEDGLNEISISGKSFVYSFFRDEEEKIKFIEEKISPNDFGLNIFPLSEIEGGDPEVNKKIFLDIVNNRATEAQKSIVVLNTAFAMLSCMHVRSVEEGIDLANGVLVSGKVVSKLKDLVDISNKL